MEALLLTAFQMLCVLAGSETLTPLCCSLHQTSRGSPCCLSSTSRDAEEPLPGRRGRLISGEPEEGNRPLLRFPSFSPHAPYMGMELDRAQRLLGKTAEIQEERGRSPVRACTLLRRNKSPNHCFSTVEGKSYPGRTLHLCYCKFRED